jgi:hypothetical protein
MVWSVCLLKEVTTIIVHTFATFISNATYELLLLLLLLFLVLVLGCNWPFLTVVKHVNK